MKIEATTRANLKTIGYIALSGIVSGIVFAMLFYGIILHILAEAALIGLLITGGSSVAEIFYFSKNRIEIFRSIIIKRSAFYLLWISFSILLVLFVFDTIQQEETVLTSLMSKEAARFLRNDFLIILFVSIAVSYLINFISQLTRMVGGKVILNLFLGKYTRPSVENRIFMFLDLKSSTEIAERLGATRYSEFLRDFFLDLANPVAETGGEIYQYVGDEVVITWLFTGEPIDKRCIDCFFLIKEKIESRKLFYADKYGEVPDFKSGVHAGKSVITEVGELQREIVYHGDVLNTASRIQKECNSLNEPILISDVFYNMVNIQDEYDTKKIGYFFLRGKTKGIELFSVRKKALKNVVNHIIPTSISG